MEYTQEEFNNKIEELSKDYDIKKEQILEYYSELRTYDFFTYDERGLECLEIACQSIMFGNEEENRTGLQNLYISTKEYAINNALYEEYTDEAIEFLDEKYIRYRRLNKAKKIAYDYSPAEDELEKIDEQELSKKLYFCKK